MRIDCLNAGYVELLDSMGGDKAVIRAARECYQSKGNTQADQKLIEMLVKNNHSTPLEHCVFTFEVKCPIFVARQWMRHRIGSYNEKSLRYCEAKPEFYLPYENGFYNVIRESNSFNFATYQYLISRDVPREQARTVLPLGLYTEFIWTVNASSLRNFIELRSSKHAQQEIRVYANVLLELAKTVAPVTFGEIEKGLTK